MNTTDKISSMLRRMSELARRGNSISWGASLERAALLVEQNASEGMKAIVGMYGGMGSLNDVVLYNGNEPLFEENEEFDLLRSELYELCQNLLH